MQQIFEAIDTNADGFLDRNELLEYFKTAATAPRATPPRERQRAEGATKEQK